MSLDRPVLVNDSGDRESGTLFDEAWWEDFFDRLDDAYGGGVSGTYTPSVSGVSNVATANAAVCMYTRIGDIVTVSGACQIEPSSSGVFTSFNVSLPIASTFTLGTDVSGSGATDQTDSLAVAFDMVAGQVRGRWTPASGGLQDIYFVFSYQVK